jgi:diguanylate cyclase (GGDEF)-like protein
MGCDFFYLCAAGNPGSGIRTLLTASLTLYYIFQVSSFYLIFLFFDYLTFKDLHRIKIAAWISAGIMIFHLILLGLNLRFGFSFYLSPDNRLVHGSHYFVRYILSYLPLLFLAYDLITGYRNFWKSQVYMILFFFVLTNIGATLDLIFQSSTLIWPCVTSALLYAYFFIVRTDSRIDSLTGLGNRYSFNEYIDNLSRQNTRRSYSIVMIDVDHLKQINDTLGHLEGDNALRDLALIINSCIRHTDFAARYGGDEFILAAKAEYDIEKLMERIKAAIDNQNEKNFRPYKIQISYGFDVFTTHSDQLIEEFLAHVDSLMYQNKAEHRRKTDKLEAESAAPDTNLVEPDKPR